MHFDRCCEHHACAGVYVRQVTGCCEHQRTHLRAHSLQDVHMRSCICILFVALENEDGGVQLVYEVTFCLARGVVFDRWRDRAVVCVFSIFNAGGSVCGCKFVCTHTHTHTAHKGYSGVSPGVGIRHLEGPQTPDGLNLGIPVFVYVYKVQICMYMLKGPGKIFGDSYVTIAQWRRARNLINLGYLQVPGSIPAENLSTQINVDLSQ